MYTKKLVFILFLLSFTFCLSSLEKYIDEDMLSEHSKAIYTDKGIILTLPEDIGYEVFMKSNLDNWKEKVYFHKNYYGIYYTIIKYTQKVDKVLYKLNINGYWVKDPMNSNYVSDKFGNDISILKIPQDYIYEDKSPFVYYSEELPMKVLFKYYNPEAKSVNFAYSVDNYNVYSHSMKKNSDGYWEIEKYFTEGNYAYFFFVDGKIVRDYSNNNKKYHPRYGEISYFILK